MENITMVQFVNRYKVRITSELTDTNPHITDMVSGSAHWRVTLKTRGRQMTLYFSQGPAVIEEPKAADVLDCLASDCSGLENAQSFEDWAGDYGYDTDSRKAEQTYRTIQRQCDQLQKLLGPDVFNTLLWHTERL